VRGERGSATLFAVACLSALLLLGAALGVVAAMVRAHRVAQSAADLAALAAADAVGTGRDPCAAGSATAAANDAILVACDLDGRDAVVTVTVDGPHWLGQAADLSAQARAGPAVAQ
jgi:secretion/DNA translocation related TadE-like protein